MLADKQRGCHMWPMNAIALDWTGKPLTIDQMTIIQDAALDFEDHDNDSRLMFEHPLCAGMIECKGRTVFGEFRGMRFVATLDADDGKNRRYEFLLTDYYEKSFLRSAKRFWCVEPKKGRVTEVDAEVTRKTRTSSFKRSRLN